MNRRDFLWAAAGAGLAFAGGCAGPAASRGPMRVARRRTGRLNVALIGVGGRGQVNVNAVVEAGERVVALCDVDGAALLAARERVAETDPGARIYKDFRVMLEAEPEVDAVFVSTPDHGHAAQAAWAMARGCHVYVEPPLARTLAEARFLGARAAACGVRLRLGDQGSATGEFRRAADLLRAGVIGEVREIHAWTSRPIWPQGIGRPEGSDPVPETLDWDLWMGGAAVRPYKEKVYHRYNWRGWHDFGTGALGDVGCHLLGLPFRALGLGAPLAVQAVETAGRATESFPKASRLRFEFRSPGRGRGAVALNWYDGTFRPVWEEVTGLSGAMPSSGCLLVGERGVWLAGDETGRRHALALKGERKLVDAEKHEACAAEPVRPRGAGLQREFLDAIREGRQDTWDDVAAGSMMESVLAGCVAQRVGGRLIWDGKRGRFANSAEANRLVAAAYRAGWGLDAARL